MSRTNYYATIDAKINCRDINEWLPLYEHMFEYTKYALDVQTMRDVKASEVGNGREIETERR